MVKAWWARSSTDLIASRFGMATLLFNFIPLVGLLFSFTNTVGAALWAAQLEAETNIIDNQASPKKKTQ